MRLLQSLHTALLAYRECTQDASYGTRVQQGKAQLVRVTYDAKGNATVEEISPWLTVEALIQYIEEASL
jgi:hypothetical protein